MQNLLILQSFFKWILLLSVLTMAGLYFKKDKLPEPAFYDLSLLEEPVQFPTERDVFKTRVNEQEYIVTPKLEYILDGVVVSYNDSDGFLDIWHHKRWLDFLNQRDLCVIWGKNVESGVYKNMKFSNDSWTCWASWPDSATGSLFKMNALSNNHLLVDSHAVAAALITAEPGDHIRFKGVLAEYANPANGFKRGTSITRNDTGNGACETVYVTEFEIVKKANQKIRRFYSFAKGLAMVSLAGFLILFFITPVRVR